MHQSVRLLLPALAALSYGLFAADDPIDASIPALILKYEAIHSSPEPSHYEERTAKLVVDVELTNPFDRESVRQGTIKGIRIQHVKVSALVDIGCLKPIKF